MTHGRTPSESGRPSPCSYARIRRDAKVFCTRALQIFNSPIGAKVTQQRDALLAKRIAKAADNCTTGKPATAIPLLTLVDETAGLGFQGAAIACPAADGETVDDTTLLTCVYRATLCTAEGTVARAIPSAVDLLGQLDLDATTVFSCVTTDLEGS